MPEGVFRLLFDDGIGVGTALVQHPLIRAVGFTGSRQGGLALITLAQSRSVPIPVFAEMSSINPVFVLPGRLQTEPEALAEQVHTSATMGVGQFCTNPGVVILCGVDGADRFLSRLTELMDGTAASCMLTDGIAQAYANGVHRLEAHPATKKLTTGPQASVFVTNAQAFAQEPELKHEVFGPCTLVVQCESVDEAESLLSGFEGQLTATILAAPAEIPASLLESCELIAGRILVNQMPTGLEVCSATVHGGPFPATSDGRSTSVGTRAIERWTRPVCYQNVPTDLLPVELRD
jgi:acyl-CoA reductase-like NAD-dependent aldehyde dehydrogenase